VASVGRPVCFTPEVSLAGKQILVVEDDTSIANFVKKALESKGHIITLAKDGIAGMTILEGFKPDLIILDIMMPRLDGMTLAKALNKKKEHIPIIFVTAKTDPQSMIAGIGAGAKFYITKPFRIAELMSKVEKALGG
jgi:DNA-binding response OmpR family regulator